MRSRSSRLFVVLLHLVGVSTNFPKNSFLAALHPENLRSGVGILGVHPLSILLEPLELQAAGGLNELLSLLEGAGYDVEKTILGAPYWLQDDTDGKCLGPAGFSECGDATLWDIRRRPISSSSSGKKGKRNRRARATAEYSDQPSRRGLLALFRWSDPSNDVLKDEEHSTNETRWEYALELVDVNPLPQFRDNNNQQHESSSTPEEDRQLMGECMLSISSSGDTPLIGPCSSDQAWSWSINEGGILQWDERQITSATSAHDRQSNKAKIFLGGPSGRFMELSSGDKIDNETPSPDQLDKSVSKCLWRSNGDTTALTAPCNESGSEKKRLVNLSVIQYQHSAAVSPKLPRFAEAARQANKSNELEPPVDENEDEQSHLPHRQSKSTSRSSSPKDKISMKVPLGVGGYYNEHPQLKTISSVNTKPSLNKKKSMISTSKDTLRNGGGNNLLHHPPTPVGSLSPTYSDAPHKPRKIPVHPYIAASKDGLYEDPQTGLTYPTDISTYLGHDRFERGRHTLMGVGLFTKTMLKIKIYGVALYVPKRDALADERFSAFAGMNVNELRRSDAFYEHLMSPGQNDRTLFIKLNMQLATETVRASLSAEWKLLSKEHKQILSDSSVQEREANEDMLRKIKSEENSSNCSCGQIAPEEYEADMKCCARGTELVFTWRKNGDLELRIDGRIMDTFTEPAIGRGIFYEYLRGDDPMSMDARDHFADGFPFLLAPLAQVKGVSSSVPKQDTFHEPTKPKGKGAPLPRIGKFVEELIQNIDSHANDATVWVHGNINGGISNVVSGFTTVAAGLSNAANETKHFTSNVRYIGAEIDRKRETILSNANIFLKRRLNIEDKKEDDVEDTVAEESRRNIFRPQIAKMLGESSSQRPLSDEIGVIIEPSMSSTHMLFLYMVHFYLVLLLIVSIPDSYTTRLVVKRSSASTISGEDSESLSDDDYRWTQFESIPSNIVYNSTRKPPIIPWDQLPNDTVPKIVVETTGNSQDEQRCMKKSLSYYL